MDSIENIMKATMDNNRGAISGVDELINALENFSNLSQNECAYINVKLNIVWPGDFTKSTEFNIRDDRTNRELIQALLIVLDRERAFWQEGYDAAENIWERERSRREF